MLRNFSNPHTNRSLESLVADINAQAGSREFVHLLGFEVVGTQHRAHERYTLVPAYNSLGLTPNVGDLIECSALGSSTAWQVVAIAQGQPGDIRIER